MKKFILVSLLFLVSCVPHANVELDARKSYWEKTLSDEIPVGTPKEKVLSWAQSHSINFYEMTDDKSLSSTIESVPDSGIGSLVQAGISL